MKDEPRIVFVISPLKGDIEHNIEQASKYCRQIAIDGDVPIAPHIYTTRFLDDTNPIERKMGMIIGHFLMRLCTEARTFENALTEGMTGDILEARDVVGIPVNHMGNWLKPKCEPGSYAKLSRKELEKTAESLQRRLTVEQADKIRAEDEKESAEDTMLRFHKKKKQAEKDLDELKGRLRTTAQIIISEIGSAGPQNAEDAAKAIVYKLQQAKAKLVEMERT